MQMSEISLRVLPRNFAMGPPFPVDRGWYPRPVAIHQTDPPQADVIAAALPTSGGMRIVVYNRESFPVTVTLPDRV